MNLKEFKKKYGITSDSQLIDICNRLNIKLNNVGFVEDNDYNINGSYIINLGNNELGGTHWTSLFIEDNKAFYFDSFAGPPEDILIKKLQDYGIVKNLYYNNKFEFQKINEDLCGIWCIVFLYYMNSDKSINLKERFNKMCKEFKDTL